MLFVCGFSHVNRITWWSCLCDCGAMRILGVGQLRSGHTQSCGCLVRARTIERNHARKGKPRYALGTPKPEFPRPGRAVFIYALTDPAGEIRYIGKAIGSWKARLDRHLQSVRCGRDQTYKGRWIRKLLATGQQPGFILLEECRGDGCAEEIFHIRLARADGLRLTNATDGGEGAPGFKHRPETIEKLRRIKTGVSNHTPESRAKISQAGLGRKHSRESVERRAAKLRGRKLPPEQVARLVAIHKRRKHSPEERLRKSLASRGRKQSPTHYANLRAAQAASPRVAAYYNRGKKSCDEQPMLF